MRSLVAGAGEFITWRTERIILTADRSFWQEKALDLEKKYQEYKSDYHKLLKESSGQVSIQIELKNRIAELEKELSVHIQSFEDYSRGSQADVNFLEAKCNGLESALDRAENSRVLAEARVSDLQDALRIERTRFDSALAHEREVDSGIRTRAGLVPREPSAPREGGTQPIATRRQPWEAVQANLGKLQKDNQEAIANHWKDKIAQVEKSDEERGITSADDGTGHSTAESRPIKSNTN